MDDQESLRDLTGVRVSVEDLGSAAKASGLSLDGVRHAVEERLRRANIPLLTTGDFPLGDPFLRVQVNATTESRGSIAYTVEVDFVQMVFMRRNPAVTFNRAQTWRAPGALGVVDPRQLADVVTRELVAQVDRFIADYQVVNTK